MSLATMTGRTMQTEERDLRWLLEGVADAPAVRISGISTDSRTLRAGEAFLACRGAGSHGLDYLEQALARGAAAVVWGDGAAGGAPEPAGVDTVYVPDLSDRLGDLANRWFGNPSARMKVSGVTGTNGKTTVAFLVAQCMQLVQKQCAYMGTLGAGIDSLGGEPGLTTPGCIDLHRNLGEFVANGAGFAAIEVSSHALAQHRTAGVSFDCALFTNLSRDHIDYHGDMDAYGETKARFLLQEGLRHRIVLTDSAFGAKLAERCGDHVAVSTQERPAFSRLHVHMHAAAQDRFGSAVEVQSSWGEASFHLPLVGNFNVANAALVLAQLLCWDVPLAQAADALSRVQPPAGRMQRVQVGGAAPIVYVDYAHTPAGLESVLATLRDHCTGKLWCVFGCGGDRDRGKRALMGRAVAGLADRPVLTSDNPRTEPPGRIISDTLAGMEPGTIAIEDRAAAIAFAIANAADEDIVLIAGKGHEDYQIVGRERRPFSDQQVARTLLERRVAGAGR